MTIADFYNDNDSAACAWMGELMAGGHIPAGFIDSRSILDVRPDDLSGFRRCHFFSGVAGWAEALRIAGWEGPCWTGSPPCQSFSIAGKGLGRDDPRHLAPAFVELVRACRPPVLFGEQVASADVVGRASGGAKWGAGGEPAWAWCDDLFVRLEAAGYACGAAVVPACSVGAPHIRQRLFFGAVRLADSGGAGLEVGSQRPVGPGALRVEGQAVAQGGVSSGLADANGGDASAEREQSCGEHGQQPQDGGAGGVADAECFGRERRQGTAQRREHDRADAGRIEGYDGPVSVGEAGTGRPGPTDGFWRDADWLGCRDGRWRPAQSSVRRVDGGLPGSLVPGGDFVSAAYPLAQGQARRVMRLRGYGNAIVPQAAAEFIRSFRDAMSVTLEAAS